MIDDEFRRRFKAKWRLDRKTGCWVWTASVAGKGYGQFRLPGTRRNAYAHRLAWEMQNGPVPEGKMVLHRCDAPRCVNPDHLFLGDALINLADMVTKDRHLRGERNTEAKLTESDVLEIHRLAGEGLSQRKIAAQFGIQQMQVSRILRGLRWRHVFERLRSTAARK